MADARDLKSRSRKGVRVQVPPSAVSFMKGKQMLVLENVERIKFKNVLCGQVFRYVGCYYLKIERRHGDTFNVVLLKNGSVGVCCDSDEVEVYEEAIVVLHGAKG